MRGESENSQDFLGFTGLDLGYIQPQGGDGIGFISHILRLVERYNSGQADFSDAAMLDQRAQEGPEMVRQAVLYFQNNR